MSIYSYDTACTKKGRRKCRTITFLCLPEVAHTP